MRRPHFRLPLRLFAAIIAFLFAAITATGIGVMWTQSAWRRETQAVHEQHLQLARYLAQALARYATDTEAALQLAAANLASRHPVQQLDALLRRLHFKHVCLVNARGDVEQFLAVNDAQPIASISETLLATLQDGDPMRRTAFSNILADRHGEPTLYLWYATQPGEYALGALDTTYFRQLQNAIRFGDSGHAAIVDRSGRIIAHPLEPWRLGMKDVSRLEPIRRMMSGETGVSWFYSPALQASMVAGFTSVPQTGWGVMIPQPVSELQARMKMVKWRVWPLTGGIAIAFTMAIWLLSTRLTANLRRLGNDAERVAQGDYDVGAGRQALMLTREMATLSMQFDRMAQALDDSWRAQRESETRFREFAQIAADGFWETDRRQVFTYMSPLPRSGSGQDSASYIGRHRRDFAYDEAQAQAVELIQAFMAREASFDNMAMTVKGRDGQPLHVVISGRPIRQNDGQVAGYRGVAHDVTDRLQVEALRRELQDAEETRQRQKMEALGVLAGGIAHDFNNTLAVILGFAQLTQAMLPESSRERQNVERIYAAGERAKHMVEQILAFSRNHQPERSPAHLHEVVQEALQLLRASLPATIDIRQETPSDLPDVVLANPTQLHQVLMNLCANAGHAMREAGGVLVVRIDIVHLDEALLATASYTELRPGAYVRLCIRDTGCGMPPDVLARIFEPYFTTKSIGEGTGMGLAVARGIITSHGGAIVVESQPGVGSTFIMYLPQLDVDISPDLSDGDALSLGSQETILFVDDEAMITVMMQAMLEQLGYQVEAKTSSVEALAAFRADPERFGLVITDQTLPHMTGDALAQELRALRPDVPIILCTGYSPHIDEEEAAARGFDAFCLKPFEMHELAQVIRRVLASRAAKTPDAHSDF